MKEKWETFRFANDQLQTSLIKVIERAGLIFKVRDDGTILYPEKQPIEEFVDQIVETVFRNGYYRTVILNNPKAERYRRFKTFTGTAFIEEIRSGKTYFVQEFYEKLYRNNGIPTHISFILADEELNPNKITALFGITPSFRCFKGEPFARPYTTRRKNAPLSPSRIGWWEICSIPDIESNEILVHIEWLFEKIGPISSELQSLREHLTKNDNVIIQLNIVISRSDSGHLSLSKKMLNRLGKICDTLDTVFWHDDYI